MKNVIREGLAMIVLVGAILLILIMVFFDFIQDSSNVPVAKPYLRDGNALAILQLKESFEDSENAITLSTSSLQVDAEMLNQYVLPNETGQSHPFDEAPITRIEYDTAGNAYYKVSDDTIVRGFDYVHYRPTEVDENGNIIYSDTTGSSTQSVSGTTNPTTQDRPLYTTPGSGK